MPFAPEKLIQIRLSRESDRPPIFELRKEAYAELYGDTAAKAGVAWNEFDSRGVVLVAEHTDSNIKTIVSTMRISLLDNETDFEKVMTFSSATAQVQLPVISINRLATRKQFRSRGLIGQMRKMAIQLAALAEANAVIGSSEAASLHFRQLSEIGYIVRTLPNSWTGNLKNTSPIRLGVLPKDRFSAAIDLLTKRISERASTARYDEGFQASENLNLEVALSHLRPSGPIKS